MSIEKSFSISGNHKIIRIFDARGNALVKVRCEDRGKETEALLSPSLDYCPFCEFLFDKKEIDGNLIRERLEIFLKYHEEFSKKRDIVKSMEEILEIPSLSYIPDNVIKGIINCLEIKPILRGKELLSEIGCFGAD